jgi:hypothetical protein
MTIRTPSPGQGKHAAIMGHDVAGARLTAAGVLWLGVYLGLPVLVLGNLIDALLQWSLGWCVGLWCIVS